ncbi:potassium channel family protein [Oceanobacillus saliphilus]|uniref:potassium channel family protein n=1 Tax=Oceanobacillus saliphilus TaxID=2925834 RepID=UPI00201D3F27|nr:potassium channel family protein [Oceanobacillus saliphilus]
MYIRFLKQVYFRLPTVLKLLVTIFVLMSFFGFLIHIVEPTQFPTIFDGIWWAFVTGATVGYGDYVPLTQTGRMIAILLILTGGGFLAFYITSLSAATVKREQEMESGKLAFKGSHHYIFIGWNERTRQLIDIVVKKHPSIRIVLIDRTLRHLTFQESPVHFIHGDATEDSTLIKANIAYASRVLISADITKNERQSDNYTILATIAVRGNHKEIPIVAEILSQRQIENALRAGANTIIRSNDFMSSLFFHELSNNRKATSFEDIIQILGQQQFLHTKLSTALENQTYKTVLAEMLKEEKLVLGYIREGKYFIHPTTNQILVKDDILISLTRW